MATRTSPRWPLFCALVAVLAHWRALGNGFALDDVRLVESNPAIVSLAHVPKLFLEPYWNVAGENYGLYRPLTVASLSVNRALLGTGPFGFHLVNLLLHAAVAALAWLTLRRAGTYYGTALLGGLLFAVLPVHTEAVANVAGRAELLAALFVLAAWLAHRRASEEGASAGRWRLGAAWLYFAAILSKESAVLAPVLFFADDALRGREAAPRRGRLLAGYAMALAAMLALRALALGVHQSAAATIPLDNPAAAAGWWPRVLTAVWVQLKFALLCLAPRQLVSDYSFDAIPVAYSLADPRALGGVAFLAALVAAAAWGWRRSRPVALAVLVWVVFFLPSANLLFPAGTIMAERLAYLPSLGLCLAIGHLGAAFATREGPATAMRARRVVVVALAAVVILGFAARTWVRIPDWKSNLRLALADVATMPRSAKLQAGAGMFLEDVGRVAEAEEHLRRAVKIFPEYAQMHYNLAVLLVRRGAREEAEAHLRRAIELAPGNPLPRRLLDQLIHSAGRQPTRQLRD
jgi:tetratricopeptide (TPR) repeat protein